MVSCKLQLYVVLGKHERSSHNPCVVTSNTKKNQLIPSNVPTNIGGDTQARRSLVIYKRTTVNKGPS